MSSFRKSAIASVLSDSILDSAVQTLTNNGFAIVDRSEDSVTLHGPGLNSTRQNPLLGATRIKLALNGKTLDADAELGGVQRMQRFLSRLPFLLGLGLGLFFGVGGGILFGQLFGVGFGVPWAQGSQWLLFAICVSMLPVAPWLFISPLMSRSIQKRTEDAITTLVRNATFTTNPA